MRSRECACGCGEVIEGPRQKRYVDDSHRQCAGRRRRWGRSKKEAEQAAARALSQLLAVREK